MSHPHRLGILTIALILSLPGIAGCGSGGSDGTSEAVETVRDAPATSPDTGTDASGAASPTDQVASVKDEPLKSEPASGAEPVPACAASGTTFELQQQFLASNPDAGDRFASALAMSDHTIAIAAESEDSEAAGLDGDQTDNSLANAGAVYLWECQDGAWRQTHYLKAAQTAQNDYFGSSLALYGDTLIVGAKGRTVEGKSYVGAAFVYRKSQDGWLQVATLTEPSLPANALYGYSVAISGDVAVVGAPGVDSNAGKLFFYRRTGDSWTLEDAVSGTDGAYLGRKVALSGETVITNSTGAALVYERSAQGNGSVGWTLRASLSGKRWLYGLEGNVTFGRDAVVAINGDRIAVTSPTAMAISTVNAGIACAFKRVGTDWIADGYCFAPEAPAYQLENMFFGQSGVAILDNGKIVVTADADSSAGVAGHGSVFVFAQSGSAWTQDQYILSPAGPQRLINFGFSGMAAAGNRFIVSEQLHSGTAATQGAAYLFGAQ